MYHLASVRLRDLCLKLDISSELRGKIWTCFEHSLLHCTDLMKDRHLDQLLLCAVYIISKVQLLKCGEKGYCYAGVPSYSKNHTTFQILVFKNY